MKQLIMILVFILLLVAGSLPASAQGNQTGYEEIKKQMAKIRQSTNWESADESKKANEQIRALSIKLMQGSAPVKAPVNPDKKEKDAAEGKMEFVDQMMKSVRKGEGADVLLGEPIQMEIVEEYKNDQSPKIQNGMFLEEMTLLCLDMSLPTIQRTIDQMRSYKAINTLVILSSKNGSKVNLSDLMDRAAQYPLKELYIINFREFVSTLPPQVANFKNLTTLSLMKNSITTLPVCISSLIGLKELYLDMNPLTTLLPTIQTLKSLKKLGLVKTHLADKELVGLKNELPNCQILTK